MARDDREPGAADRRLLMLQGPPGPLFRLLAARLRKEGAEVERVLLNGGDEFD